MHDCGRDRRDAADAGLEADPSQSADPVALEHRRDAVIRVSIQYAYTEPGTYFPGMRATARRHGDGGDWPALIENIARARVVLSE
jgi:hypothetical protein